MRELSFSNQTFKTKLPLKLPSFDKKSQPEAPGDKYDFSGLASLDADPTYIRMSGTSMATPTVSGIGRIFQEMNMTAEEKAEMREAEAKKAEEFRDRKEASLDDASLTRVKKKLEESLGLAPDSVDLVQTSEETFNDSALGFPDMAFQVPTRGRSILLKSNENDDYYLLRHPVGDEELGGARIATWSGSDENPVNSRMHSPKQISEEVFDYGHQS